MTKPFVIAHRGSSFDVPENTLLAFERAIAEGADGIELDVRLTRDGVPVCIHDAMLRRTGLRAGHVSRITTAELVSVDAGTWFNRRYPRRANESNAAARIPTLAETLRCCLSARSAKFSVYVEMKCVRGEEAALAAAVAHVLRSEKRRLHIIVASFTLGAVSAIKSCDSSIRTAALFEPTFGEPRPRIAQLLARAQEAGASELLLHRALITRRGADAIAAQGFPLVVWTVDDRRWAARAAELNLHALMTNRPALMREALAARTPVP